MNIGILISDSERSRARRPVYSISSIIMLSDESDIDDIHTLTINEHYAKAFEYRKEREELAKREYPLNLSA